MSSHIPAPELQHYNESLRQASPQEILAWTIGHFPEKVVLTVSFGGGGIVLAHLMSEIDRSVPVVFLDTGMHFQETYDFKARFAERYDINVIDVHPVSDPGPLYQTDPDRCCDIRKVEPMQRVVQGYDAWVSAVRRDQSATRRQIQILEYQTVGASDVLKVYPLAQWSRADVWRYLYDHSVPYHPLLDQGYTSIGCWPCTRPTQAGEDERAGRWSGRGKTECGLHAFSESAVTSAVIAGGTSVATTAITTSTATPSVTPSATAIPAVAVSSLSNREPV